MASKADQTERDAVERAPGKLVGQLAHQLSAAVTTKPDPERAVSEPPSARSPWVRPISDYERKETTVVEGRPFG